MTGPVADPEEVFRVLATAREERPGEPLSALCDLIDWPVLRKRDEPWEHYQERLYGKLEPYEEATDER